MMVGDIIFEHSIQDRLFPTVLYLIFLMSVAIILLNALIALMDTSFRRATETKGTAVLVSRLKFLTELEIKSIPFISIFGIKQDEKNLGDLVILLLESDWNISELSEQASPLSSIPSGLIASKTYSKYVKQSPNDDSHRSKIEINEANSFNKDEVNHAKIENLEARIKGMENKLDQIISLLSSRVFDKSENYESMSNNYTNTNDKNICFEGENVSYSYFGDEDLIDH
jgi:hypothetical protein